MTSIALNTVVNGVLPERWHIPASLAASAAVCGLALRAGVSIGEQGLRPANVPRGALYGLAAAAPLSAAVAAGAFVGGSRSFYQQRRITDTSGARAAYEVCVRIPFGTALPEEAIFRGALLGLFSRYQSPAVASGLTSLLFGFWHIAPTLRRLPTDELMSSRPVSHKAGWVAGAVAATSAAGVMLTWLRLRSRSLLAPWLLHSAVNASGFAAAWLSNRRQTGDGGPRP